MPDGTDEHHARVDEPLPAARTAVPVAAKILDGYVGDYELAIGLVLTITREGDQLYAQATGQPRVPVFASSTTEFFLRVVDAQLSFHTDPSGRADSVVLHQGGHDITGKRVPGNSR
jgi:hypothetical protein